MEEAVDIPTGKFYTHKSGVDYQMIANSFTQLEGVWHNSITYRNMVGEVFNRLEADFWENFKLSDKIHW